MADSYSVCRIRNIRHKYGITVRELADEVKVSQQYISRLEMGLEKPTARNRKLIKNALTLYYLRQERRLALLRNELIEQRDSLLQLESET